MKPNQKNRYNGRYNNRNNRNIITRNTSLESSGPCGKLHGTALQLFEKYQAAAKDALIQNDVVQSEICLQYADHYIRLQNIAIANEQANRPQCQPKQESVADDELPTITVDTPTEETAAPAETEALSDEAVAQMDLSVPVTEMQAKRPYRPRRQTRPRQQAAAAQDDIAPVAE